MAHWLMKSEPSELSIDALKKCPKGTTAWDGVRNYQARNFLRAMKKGDLAFFYHSSCPAPGVYGVVEISREAYPDPTAFNPASEYYDPKSTSDQPRWFMVDVRLKQIFRSPTLLDAIRNEKSLRDMQLVQRGSRLSVMPVTAREWKTILKLTGEKNT